MFQKNPSIVQIHKDAPHLSTPWHKNTDTEKMSTFYVSEPEINNLIGGFAKGPRNSYARELIKKYPLRNE